jgi:hypothetical protein
MLASLRAALLRNQMSPIARITATDLSNAPKLALRRMSLA